MSGQTQLVCKHPFAHTPTPSLISLTLDGTVRKHPFAHTPTPYIYTRVCARARSMQCSFLHQAKAYHTKPCCLSTFKSASDMASLAALV